MVLHPSRIRYRIQANLLESLRMGKFVTDVTGESNSLAHVYKLIIKLSRQALITYRSDAYRVEFLSSAVAGYDWDKEPMVRIATHELNFQRLYGELEAQLKLNKEAKIAKIRDEIFTRNRDSLFGYENDVAIILFTWQRRYGQRPLSVRFVTLRNSEGQKTVKPDSKFEPLSISGCSNYDEPSHTVKECPRPQNTALAAAWKVKYYSKKKNTGENVIDFVLADFFFQLDAEASQETEQEKTKMGTKKRCLRVFCRTWMFECTTGWLPLAQIALSLHSRFPTPPSVQMFRI